MKKLTFIAILLLTILLMVSCNEIKTFKVTLNYLDKLPSEVVYVQADIYVYDLLKTSFEGFSFDGWYKDSSFTKILEEDFIVTSNIEIYANITEIEYQITYDFGLFSDAVLVNDNPYHYTKLTSQQLSTPILKENYIFVGWFVVTDKQVPFSKFDNLVGNLTLLGKIDLAEGNKDNPKILIACASSVFVINTNYDLLVYVIPNGLYSGTFSYESSDTMIAVIDSVGRVTTISEGVVTFTISALINSIYVSGTFTMLIGSVSYDYTVTFYINGVPKVFYVMSGSSITPPLDGLNPITWYMDSSLTTLYMGVFTNITSNIVVYGAKIISSTEFVFDISVFSGYTPTPSNFKVKYDTDTFGEVTMNLNLSGNLVKSTINSLHEGHINPLGKGFMYSFTQGIFTYESNYIPWKTSYNGTSVKPAFGEWFKDKFNITMNPSSVQTLNIDMTFTDSWTPITSIIHWLRVVCYFSPTDKTINTTITFFAEGVQLPKGTKVKLSFVMELGVDHYEVWFCQGVGLGCHKGSLPLKQFSGTIIGCEPTWIEVDNDFGGKDWRWIAVFA